MSKPTPKVCLVVVDVRSALNIGAMFRTCDGFGAELFLVGVSPRPEYDDDDRLPYVARRAHKQIAKTALGAEETVRWRHADTLLECKNILKEEGYRMYAIEQDAQSKSLPELTLTQNTALIVGREVEGLDQVELGLCDGIYEVPMSGHKESFNVSVAAGIALYQLSKIA